MVEVSKLKKVGLIIFVFIVIISLLASPYYIEKYEENENNILNEYLLTLAFDCWATGCNVTYSFDNSSSNYSVDLTWDPGHNYIYKNYTLQEGNHRFVFHIINSNYDRYFDFLLDGNKTLIIDIGSIVSFNIVDN